MSLLAGEAELLLDRELDGQPVAVPAGLAGDVEALHRLEPREHVLEDARLDVVRAGHAVGGGRALVERSRARRRRSARGWRGRRRARPRTRGPRAPSPAGRPAAAPRGSGVVRSRRGLLRLDGCTAEGTRPLSCRVPRYHPPWPPQRCRRPARSVLLPGLVASPPGRGGLSSGGSGVMAPSSPHRYADNSTGAGQPGCAARQPGRAGPWGRPPLARVGAPVGCAASTVGAASQRA